VTFDDWKIDACPHHGPSLWIDEMDRYHIGWFSAGERSGIGSFYARSTDDGRTFGRPVRLGGERAAHPFVLGSRDALFVAWLEADAARSIVRFQISENGGESWSPPATAAEGGPGADHPLLVKRGETVFLSWFTKEAGYRLVALPPHPAGGAPPSGEAPLAHERRQGSKIPGIAPPSARRDPLFDCGWVG
jgi:hypothetical protein